ncbi:hypothetical protein J6590_097665, partial [Homalodisca vitripennis]
CPTMEVLNPKKNMRKKYWSTEDIAKVIKAVRDKEMWLKKVSKQFSVPRPTLLSRTDTSPSIAAVTTFMRKPIIDEHLVKELLEYLDIIE